MRAFTITFERIDIARRTATPRQYCRDDRMVGCIQYKLPNAYVVREVRSIGGSHNSSRNIWLLQHGARSHGRNIYAVFPANGL